MDNKWAMLCKLKVAAFNSDGWRWERKLDGDRLKAVVRPGGGVVLTARSGADKTAQFPELQDIWLHGCTLDGEVVSAQGLPFQEWNQRRMNRKENIDKFASDFPAMYKVFDLLDFGGIPVGSTTSLAGRRRLLEDNFRDSGHAELVEQYVDGVALFERAVAEGWEGVVGKRLDEPYMPHRRNWVKVKRWLEQTFWCEGWEYGTGKRANKVGAIKLVDDRGRYAGMCGTGFNDAELDSMTRRLERLMHQDYDEGSRVRLIRQPFKVRVKFVEVTNAGLLRFPVYMGMEG